MIQRLFGIMLFLATLALVMNTKVSLGAAVINMDSHKRVEAVIGAQTINRIEVASEILEIVGDELKYQVVVSKDYKQIFITPKVEVGEIVDLSVVMVGGLVQDLRLTVGDVPARTIILVDLKNKGQSQQITSSDQTKLSKQDKEIAEVLQHMHDNEKGKYNIKLMQRNILQSLEKRIIQKASYRYKEYIGVILEIENLTKQSLLLNKDELKDLFKGSVALYLPIEEIPARSKILVTLVSIDKRYK